jgi:hypothetical protein
MRSQPERKQLRSWSIVGVAILLISAGPAFAQSASRYPAGFVEGAVLADLDQVFIAPATVGGGAGAGVSFSPRFSMRFEVAVPNWHTRTDDYRSRAGNNIHAGSVREDRRIRSYSILFSRDVKVGERLQLSFLGGFGVIDNEERQSLSFDVLALNGTKVGHQESGFQTSRSLAAVTVGVDAAIAVTKQLAVVPRLRLLGQPAGDAHSSNVQPGVAFRWRF